MTRYVMIGIGVAAIAAAESIRQQDTDGEILFISDDPHGYYSRPGLAYFLTGEIEKSFLFPFQPQTFEPLNFQLIHAKITKIIPEQKQILTETNHNIYYDKLLIATGARSIPLKIPGKHLKGIHKLDNLEDAINLLRNAKPRSTAIVTGGGITALEIAEGLATRKVHVHYIMRGERYWSNILDPVESSIIEKRLQKSGIQLHHHLEITEAFGKNGILTGVKLSSGKEIACNMLAYAIGIKPEIQLAINAQIDVDRGILVNQWMQSNIEHIFAAGDVAQVYDPATDTYNLDSLWPLAAKQGRTAGMNMAGGLTSYTKPIPFNITRLGDLPVTIIGFVGKGNDSDLVNIARGDSETWRKMPDLMIAQSGFDINHIRLILNEKQLFGAVVIGNQYLSRPLQHIISKKIDISSIYSKIKSQNTSLSDTIAAFWENYYSSVTVGK